MGGGGGEDVSSGRGKCRRSGGGKGERPRRFDLRFPPTLFSHLAKGSGGERVPSVGTSTFSKSPGSLKHLPPPLHLEQSPVTCYGGDKGHPPR